jgi:hypothetical protein
MAYETISVAPIAGALGAEVSAWIWHGSYPTRQLPRSGRRC